MYVGAFDPQITHVFSKDFLVRIFLESQKRRLYKIPEGLAALYTNLVFGEDVKPLCSLNMDSTGGEPI